MVDNMGFYAGECENCGQQSEDRDCLYNNATGAEVLWCENCVNEINAQIEKESEE